MVKRFSDGEVEVIGEIHATLGSEMIKVVNYHQCGFEIAYGFDDVLMYCFVALVESTDVIEAHDTEVVGVDVKIALEVIHETTNSVEGVDGINPEDFSRYDLRLIVVVLRFAAVGLLCYLQ